MPKDQTIYFHIGIGKTGSSFLQSSLALAGDVLDDAGLFYPIDADEAERVAKGYISSGNMRVKKGLPQSGIHAPAVQKAARVLFSNESLHHMMRRSKQFTSRIRKPFPEARMEFLVYIRDPLDHAISAYQQAVKRSGYTGTCAEFLREYDHPLHLIDLAERLSEIDGHLTVVNYSRHRDNLLGTLETWLGLPEGSLPKPKIGQVNRSLTLGELELQRVFNQYMGQRAARVISTPLCNQLPDIRSDQPALSMADLDSFLTRMDDIVQDPRLLALIPESERYHVGKASEYEGRFPDPADVSEFQLSTAQLDVVAQALTRMMGTEPEPAKPAGQKKGQKKARKERRAQDAQN